MREKVEAALAQIRKKVGVVTLVNEDHYFGCFDLGRDYILRPRAVKGKGFARALVRP